MIISYSYVMAISQLIYLPCQETSEWGGLLIVETNNDFPVKDLISVTEYGKLRSITTRGGGK